MPYIIGLQMLPTVDQLPMFFLTIGLDFIIRLWLGIITGVNNNNKNVAASVRLDNMKKVPNASYTENAIRCFIITLTYCFARHCCPGWEFYTVLLVQFMESYKYDAVYNMTFMVVGCLWPTSSVRVLQLYGVLSLYIYRLSREIIVNMVSKFLLRSIVYLESGEAENNKVKEKIEKLRAQSKRLFTTPSSEDSKDESYKAEQHSKSDKKDVTSDRVLRSRSTISAY